LKWRLQFIMLVMLLPGVMIGGIYLAEKGTQRVDGIRDGPAQSFSIVRMEDGMLEMTVLGRQYFVHDGRQVQPPSSKSLDAKQEDENSAAHSKNWFSEVGNFIGNQIRSFTRGLLDRL
jgi:hypothetical protein